VDTIYSCCPENSSPQYEVHVLAVYGANSGGSSHAGIVTVNIISGGTSNRPVVLVLVNEEPVKWILIIPFHITISKVILVSRRNSISHGFVSNFELMHVLQVTLTNN
jgi:hypothetical protein